MGTQESKPGLVSCLLLATTLGWAVALAADPVPSDRLELEETVISGNEELPKVLYIVPWRQAEGRPVLPAPTTFAEDGLFRRLQPSTHKRELAYLEQYRGSDPEE